MQSAAALQQAHAAYRWLARGLAQQRAGLPSGALPAWAHPGAVQSLSLALPDHLNTSAANCAPCLHVALRDGIPGRALPATLERPGGIGSRRSGVVHDGQTLKGLAARFEQSEKARQEQRIIRLKLQLQCLQGQL